MRRNINLLKLLEASCWNEFACLLTWILAVLACWGLAYILWGMGFFGVVVWIVLTVVAICLATFFCSIIKIVHHSLLDLIEESEREEQDNDEDQ